MASKRSFTTLLKRLHANPHHSPSIRELHDRLERYVLSADAESPPGRGSVKRAGTILVARVLKRVQSFAAGRQSSAEWIGLILAELEAEFRATLVDAKVLRDVINQLHRENAERVHADAKSDPAALEMKVLVQAAIARVQNAGQFEDKTWQAYWLYDHENKDRAAIAEVLGIRPDTVFKYVTRVRRAVQAEIDRTQQEGAKRERGATSE